jgi:hypothetical protein
LRLKKIALITFTFIISFIFFLQQNEFEKTLGKENVETLNSLIENFETITLKKEYPNLNTENAYKEFLKSILKNNWVKGRKIFPETKLKLNIYCVPDSIWIEERKLSSGKKGEMIKTKYKCLNPNDEIIYSSLTSYCCNVKSETLKLLERLKEDVQINMIGSYIKALEKVSKESEVIESYLENIKMTAEPIRPYAMAEHILKNNIDTNDYFIKRLIFINMIYR